MKKSLVVFLATLCLIGCGKVSISPKKAMKNVGETYNVKVDGGTASEYYSVNPFVAIVDNAGLVTAKHVGETQIGVVVNKDQYESQIQVMPTITAFEEPMHDWTFSAADIKKTMGTPAFSTEADGQSIMVYMDLTTKCVIAYMCENDKLYGTAIVFFGKYDRAKIKSQLTEYYELLGEEEDVELEEYEALFADGYEEGQYASTCPISTYVVLGEGSIEDMGMDGMDEFLPFLGGAKKACIVAYMSADSELEL